MMSLTATVAATQHRENPYAKRAQLCVRVQGMNKPDTPTKDPRRKGRYLPPSPEAVRDMIIKGPWKSRPEMHKTLEGRRIENWASIFRIPVAALLRELHGSQPREGYVVLSGEALRKAIAKGPWKTRADMRKSARGRQLERWAVEQKVLISPILRGVHGPLVRERKWTVETVTAAALAGPWASRSEMIKSVEGRRISKAAEVLNVKIAPLLAHRGVSSVFRDSDTRGKARASKAAQRAAGKTLAAQRGAAKGMPANCWLFG